MLSLELLFCLAIVAVVVLTEVNSHDTPMLTPANSARYMQRLNTGLQSKVVSGNDAKENAYPFVVYIVDDQDWHYCTGVLFDRRWVLTAAHCLMGGATRVVLGVYDRSTNVSSSKQLIDIAEEIRHPAYRFDSIVQSDIGLIRLARPANIRSEAVSRTAILKSKSVKAQFLANEKMCIALGWGVVLNDGVWSLATRLQQLKQRFFNDTEVQQRGYSVYPTALYNGAVHPPGETCRQGMTCNGDSGGPVVCRKGGSWIVVAVTSFFVDTNYGCFNNFSGSTDVLQHVPWIESVLGA